MTIELQKADAGRDFSLGVGERATVRLPETPTTGYRWVAEFDEERLRLVEDNFGGPDAPAGAGGERTLVFEALARGRTRLALQKKRAWGSEEPAEVFAVGLEVTD